MAINSMSGPMAANIFEGGTRRIDRALPVVRARNGAWPWPLPVDSVLAIFDDRPTALNALQALADDGAGLGVVWMASGEDGARRLHESFAQRGALSRLRSRLDGEDETAAQVATRCARGATAVLLQSAHGQVQDVMQALGRDGARLQYRTGRWTWEWVARDA